jgi:hypothetical protein
MKTKTRKSNLRRRKPVNTYTHRDASGMAWRFDGGRPVSALADQVMAEVMGRKR